MGGDRSVAARHPNIPQEGFEGLEAPRSLDESPAAAFADFLMEDVLDEIPGSPLRLDSGTTVWLHTPTQVKGWIRDSLRGWLDADD
jgi:hypothetical protein